MQAHNRDAGAQTPPASARRVGRAMAVGGLAALCLGLLPATAPAPAQNRPACAANAQFRVIDTAKPVTELRGPDGRPALELIKSFGVTTIFRYYDWHQESIGCKTLLRAEADAILAAGLSIAVVFQHHNDDPETFIDPSRGKTDATRSLALAEALGQPFGSAIYFGVDGVDQVIASAVWEYAKSSGGPIGEARRRELVARMSQAGFNKHNRFYERFRAYHAAAFGRPAAELRPEYVLPFVRTYFEGVRGEFERAAPDRRYVIGAYGSGLVCEFLLAGGLARTCWLAQSTGWPGYARFRDGGRWSLLQQLPTTCQGWADVRNQGALVQFDFNRVNPANADFGQWSRRRPGTTDLPRPATCPALP